jgi:hypothetical protein
MSATDTQSPTTSEVAMSTHSILCPCDCGEVVEMNFGTFADTTVRVASCSSTPAFVAGRIFRKSAAAGFVSATDTPALRHRDGLVTFTG